jgi:phage terminase large subunit-like protein
MPAIVSLAASLASLPEAERLKVLADLTDDEAAAIEYDWRFWARPNQLAPAGDWQTWLLLAGRGFGKTRTGAEWVRERKKTGLYGRTALVAPTASDARDVIVEGESGILAISPSWFRPLYEPSKRRLTWPNGAIATLYSADEPERLRGPQHDGAWCDELGSWRYPEAWDLLMFGLRLGQNPQACVTTTPKPVKLVRELLTDPSTVITRGSTYDNKANLARKFLEKIVSKYEGTRLGRQELHAELLEDMVGALWIRAKIDELRVGGLTGKPVPPMKRIVVAIDPAVSTTDGSDETGLIIAGLGEDNHGYVLEDRSSIYSPEGWASEAVAQYRDKKADRIVAEINQGGDMVESTIRMVDRNVSYKGVHATKGKAVRAEPVAALYEQGRIHHVGAFPALEDQMCGFTVDFDRKAMGYSPDRMDALVWAFTELMVEDNETGMLDYYAQLAAQAKAAKEQK